MQIRFLLLAATALAVLTPARAQRPGTPEESATVLLNTALNYLTNADAERDDGNAQDAATLYKEAAEKYGALARRYPEWQKEVIQFRIAYCTAQLKELQARAAAATNAAATNASAPRAAPPRDKAAAAKPGKLESLKAHAAELLRAGDPGRTRTVLLEALRLDPDDSSVRLMLAIAQCQAAAYGDAALILTQLIEEEPTNAAAHMVLGAAYLGQGRFEDAGGETAMALTLNDKDPAGHYNMARIFLHLSPPDLDNAKSHYRKYLDLGGKPDAALQTSLESAKAPAPSAVTNAPAPGPADARVAPPTNTPASAISP